MNGNVFESIRQRKEILTCDTVHQLFVSVAKTSVAFILQVDIFEASHDQVNDNLLPRKFPIPACFQQVNVRQS